MRATSKSRPVVALVQRGPSHVRSVFATGGANWDCAPKHSHCWKRPRSPSARVLRQVHEGRWRSVLLGFKSTPSFYFRRPRSFSSPAQAELGFAIPTRVWVTRTDEPNGNRLGDPRDVALRAPSTALFRLASGDRTSRRKGSCYGDDRRAQLGTHAELRSRYRTMYSFGRERRGVANF
jgi:hypothetical protein